MKKLSVSLMALVCVATLAGCGQTESPATAEVSSEAVVSSEAEVSAESTEETTESSEEVVETASVMTYDEYVAAELQTEVTVETYVQAKQGWWEKDGVGVATVYTQNEEGAYFLYEMPVSKEDYDKMVPGTKIRVTGYKAEWSGEVEITEAVYEILDGSFVAEAADVTALLGTDELAAKQNQFVAFTDMTIVAAGQNDAGEDVAFLYSWDGSGSDGSDLYFNVSDGTNTYTFTVESYLCGAGTEVYETVKTLAIGDTVDMEGFLYWYNGANPHITKVVVK